MRTKLGLRVLVALFLAVLMPLEVGQCAFLMPFRATAAAVAGEHHASGTHACCEGTPAAPRESAGGASCCEYTPLPATAASASGSLLTPVGFGLAFATLPAATTAHRAQAVFIGFCPDARAGTPPSAAAALPSPRGPPHSA